MEFIALKEHVSAQSKRGAAISSTASTIYLLYSWGAATNGETVRLPFLNVPLDPLAAFPFMFLASLVAFLSWISRYVVERMHTEAFMQEGTAKALKADTVAINNLNIARANVQHADQALRVLLDHPHHEQQRKLFEVCENAPEGFSVNLCGDERQIQDLRSQWNEVTTARAKYEGATNHARDTGIRLRKLKSGDAGFGHRAKLLYEVYPVCAFFGVFVTALIQSISYLVSLAAS